MNRSLVRWGFALFLVALLTGFAIPALKIPRLGVSAHLIATMGGLTLAVVGLIWNSLRLGNGAKRVLYWLWIIAVAGNWLQTLLAGILGGSPFMPIASGGPGGTRFQDTLLSALIVTVSLIAVVAAALTVWALRGRGDTAE